MFNFNKSCAWIKKLNHGGTSSMICGCGLPDLNKERKKFTLSFCEIRPVYGQPLGTNSRHWKSIP